MEKDKYIQKPSSTYNYIPTIYKPIERQFPIYLYQSKPVYFNQGYPYKVTEAHRKIAQKRVENREKLEKFEEEERIKKEQEYKALPYAAIGLGGLAGAVTGTLPSLIGGVVAGELVNYGTKKITGKTWGEKVLPQAPFIGEFTNPGYYIGGAFKPIIGSVTKKSGTIIPKYININKVQNINPSLIKPSHINTSNRGLRDMTLQEFNDMYSRYGYNNVNSNVNINRLSPRELGNLISRFNNKNNIRTIDNERLVRKLDDRHILEDIKDNPIHISTFDKLNHNVYKLKNTIKNNIDKIDRNVGEKLINENRKVDMYQLEQDINTILQKGVGIKKENYPLKVKYENGVYNTYIKLDPNGKYERAGQIGLIPYGDTEKRASLLLKEKYNKYIKNKNAHIGVEKTEDFPTSMILEKTYNLKGVGGEYGEAIKQALKMQNKKFNLFSSDVHTVDGQYRYLNEYINGRIEPIELGTNYWKSNADAIKKLFPNGIKKNELIKIIDRQSNANIEVMPKMARFKYLSIPPLYISNYVMNGKENLKENVDSK